MDCPGKLNRPKWSKFRKLVKKIEIGEGITTICDNAFESFKNVEEVKIPSTVQIIGKWAFFKCLDLKEINVTEGVKKLDRYAFSHCEALTKINLPNTLNEIDDGAFKQCSSLRQIYIPGSVNAFGNDVFEYSYYLKDVRFCGKTQPYFGRGLYISADIVYVNSNYGKGKKNGKGKKVEEINEFGGRNVKKILDDKCEIESSIKGTCGSNIKYELDKNGLLKIDGTGDITCATKSNRYRPGWIDYKDLIKTIEISNGIENIPNGAFARCGLLSKITIPGSVKNIDGNAFYECYDLKRISIPASAKFNKHHAPSISRHKLTY